MAKVKIITEPSISAGLSSIPKSFALSLALEINKRNESKSSRLLA